MDAIQSSAPRSIPEFEIGEQVTFNPYGRRLSCTVMEVVAHSDGRIFYGLRGQAITRSTGLSIEESIHYEDHRLIALSNSITELAEREGFLESIDKFNRGLFEQGAKELAKALESVSPELKVQVKAAYLQAIGQPQENNDLHRISEKAEDKPGVAVDSTYADRRIMLAFSRLGEQTNRAIVIASQHEVSEVLESANRAGLVLTGRFPEDEPEKSPACIRTFSADFFRAQRFKETVNRGDFTPKKNTSFSL